MAANFSTVTMYPTYKTISDVSNSVATEIILPKNCRRIVIGSETHKIYVARNGGTDGAALPSDRFFIPKDNAKEISIGQGAERVDSVFIQSSGGSATVYVELNER